MPMSIDALDSVFHPESIAVVGASTNPTSYGYQYTDFLIKYGYRGKIYPVTPTHSEVLGLKAYPRLRDIPGQVSYVICCVSAPRIIELLEDCSQKGVRAIHFFTGGLGETGRHDAAKLENEILKRAREYDIRLIGPNCLGIYYPQGGLSFGYDFPKEPGTAGVLIQSGELSIDFVRMASLRGIRFSKVISYGNAIDYNESDFLDHLSKDPETKIILIYIEGVKDGPRFLGALRNAALMKPVIIIKGGRGSSGIRAVTSHTAVMAGSMRVWEGVIAQSGAIWARDLDEMTDLAVSFYFLPPIRGLRVGIVGGGGGRSVLSADEFEEAGFDVIPLPAETREEIKSKAPQIWDWIGNPADGSIGDVISFGAGDLAQVMAKSPDFDLLSANITEGAPMGREQWIWFLKSEVEGYIKVSVNMGKPLIVVIGEKSLGIEDCDNWRWKLIAELRTQLIAANIPTYPTAGRAARAVKKLVNHYRSWKNFAP